MLEKNEKIITKKMLMHYKIRPFYFPPDIPYLKDVLKNAEGFSGVFEMKKDLQNDLKNPRNEKY